MAVYPSESGFTKLFIEASRSAIFNEQLIDHRELLNTGLIDIVLNNN